MAIRIFIDQGHNPAGVNAGAEGFGVREQDITYQVGQYLYNILSEDYRFTAKLSRPTPETTLGYQQYQQFTGAGHPGPTTGRPTILSASTPTPASILISTAPKSM